MLAETLNQPCLVTQVARSSIHRRTVLGSTHAFESLESQRESSI